MSHLVTILSDIYERNKAGQDAVDIPTDDPHFEMSCKYCAISHDLFELISTMKRMMAYNELIIAKERKNK